MGSEAEQKFVKELCGEHMCWLGLRKESDSENWYWVDDTKPTYWNWQLGEPNSFADRDEHRAIMNVNLALLKGQQEESPLMIAASFWTSVAVLFLFVYNSLDIVFLILGRPCLGGPGLTGLSGVLVIILGTFIDGWVLADTGKKLIQRVLRDLLPAFLTLGIGEGIFIYGLSRKWWSIPTWRVERQNETVQTLMFAEDRAE